MKGLIYKMIGKDIVFLDSDLESKEEVINFLIEKLQSNNYLDQDSSDFKTKIIKREDEVTTYMGNSIAIPHAKSVEVKQPFVTFLRLKNLLEWNKGKNNLVNMVFMLGVPDKKEGIHLKILSNLAKKLINEKILYDLENTNSKSEVIQILEEKG